MLTQLLDRVRGYPGLEQVSLACLSHKKPHAGSIALWVSSCMDMRSMRSKSVRPMWMKSIECCGCRSRPQRKAWTEGREPSATEAEQQMAERVQAAFQLHIS